MGKSMRSILLFKERGCTVAIVLDIRTNRNSTLEYPVCIRFLFQRKRFYLNIGGSYTVKRFSEICSAVKSTSENYKIKKTWRDDYERKYATILQRLNKGGILTFEMIRTAVTKGNVLPVMKEEETSFIHVWETTIHDLKTNDNGARYTTSESYEYALKSFLKILGPNTVREFQISASEIQKWKDGMHTGIKDKNGEIIGKISDTTAGIYLRACRAVWNTCVRMGYLKDVPYPFSNKKEKGLVSIPKGKTRRQCCLTVDQMTALYNLFVSKNYPVQWPSSYREKAHYSLGLFLAQYLCNGFNLADAARLTYNDYYYQNEGKAFLFNRKKTAERSADDSEVIIPIIPALQVILDEIAAPPSREGLVFPDIFKGAKLEKDRRKRTSQENSNIQDRVIRICHEVLQWDESIRPSGTWCRHSFATNLRNAGVEMEYISASMGHSITDHSITQLYIEHYPLEKQIEYNSRLLKGNSSAISEREALLAKLASLSNEELAQLLA